MTELFDPLDVSHEKFVENYNNGKLKLAINTDAAGYLFQTVLIEHASKQANLRTLFFGGFLGGLIAIFFVGWWSLIGFAIGILGQKMSRSHTEQSVIIEALKNSESYSQLINEKIIVSFNGTVTPNP